MSKPDRLEFKNAKLLLDASGFTLNKQFVAWSSLQSVEEGTIDGAFSQPRRHVLRINAEKKKLVLIRRDNSRGENYLPTPAFHALRIALKIRRPDVVKLTSAHYENFGPEACEWSTAMGKFCQALKSPDEAELAYRRAIELIEYYHNPKHKLLIEPLEALSELLAGKDEKTSQELAERLKKISEAPKADLGFLGGIKSARSKREKLIAALDEFRRIKGREPRPVEKARILDEINYE